MIEHNPTEIDGLGISLNHHLKEAQEEKNFIKDDYIITNGIKWHFVKEQNGTLRIVFDEYENRHKISDMLELEIRHVIEKCKKYEELASGDPEDIDKLLNEHVNQREQIKQLQEELKKQKEYEKILNGSNEIFKKENQQLKEERDWYAYDYERLKEKLEKIERLSKNISQIKIGNRRYTDDVYFKRTIDTIEYELKQILEVDKQ